jgi:hypothetical protein
LLLEIFNNQILIKNFNFGFGSSRQGKNSIQSLQSLFFKPYNYNQNLELPTSLFINMNKQNNLKIFVNNFDETLVNYNFKNFDSLFENSLINKDHLFFKNILINNILLTNLNYSTKYDNNLKLLKIISNSIKNDFNNNFINEFNLENVYLSKNFVVKYKFFDSLRNKNTLFFNSNRLFLLNKVFFNYFKKLTSMDYIISNTLRGNLNFNYKRSVIDIINNINNINKKSYNFVNNLSDFNDLSLSFLVFQNISINHYIYFVENKLKDSFYNLF